MKCIFALACSFILITSFAAFAQDTAFTYQGRLNDRGHPANGHYDLRFSLYDASAEGAEIAGPLTNAGVAVSNGLFTVVLDFGLAPLIASPRWLEIGVRSNGASENFNVLTPRHLLTATPYAISSRHLTGTVRSNSLAGTYGNIVTFSHPANQFAGSFIGNGAGLSNVNASSFGGLTISSFWRTMGNAGTSPRSNFLGTIDFQAVEFRVNNVRALRLEPTSYPDSVNVIAGSPGNFIAEGILGATIGGGGGDLPGTAILGTNAVMAEFGTIAGGYGNTIGAGAISSAIAGGAGNDVGADSFYSAIGGGLGNGVAAGSIYGTIAGGVFQNVGTNSPYSTIGGGLDNNVGHNSASSTLAGGERNDIGEYSAHSVVSGGFQNEVGSNALRAVIGGGFNNQISPHSFYAVIPGGEGNLATNRAFAAGTRAKARHSGTFVWSDSQDMDFLSTAANQFNVRASGGVRIETSGAGLILDGQPVLRGSIVSTQLSDGAITSAKLADGAALAELRDDDGPGSGLNADLLDGLDSTEFSRASHDHDSSYWKLGGNTGTTPGTHFLGTSDDHPLEIRVNGHRALRLEPSRPWSPVVGAPNVIGGSGSNFVQIGVFGATIAGGGASEFNGLPHPNSVTDIFGTVSGGRDNHSTALGATIGGGLQNTSSGVLATISGGTDNTAGHWATVGGGETNSSVGGYAVIAGGHGNIAAGNYSSIGGGQENRASADGATVAGGWRNSSIGQYDTVAGGSDNTSTGWAATVGGGGGNFSAGGAATVAGGSGNRSITNFATVAGGNGNVSSGEYASIGGGSFNSSSGLAGTIGGGNGNISSGPGAVVSGGRSNIASGFQATVPGGTLNLAGGDASLAAGYRAKAVHHGAFVWGDNTEADLVSDRTNSVTMRASGGYRLFTRPNLSIGAVLEGNSWETTSDRNVKENFRPVDTRAVLDKVINLPVTEWNLISQPAEIRHIGPMAQDFKAAFGLGTSDRHISTSDANGVAFAAIQGLNQKLEEQLKAKEARINQLHQELEALKAAVSKLSTRTE